LKFSFLQGDFSAGELSGRAQGHVDSEAYKAGLRLAANCAPTRTGSVASRAGLKFFVEAQDLHAGGAANLPVQHIPIHDGPYGDFIIEVSPYGLRLMDKFGVQPMNFKPSSQFLQFTVQDGLFAYADAPTGTVYLRSLATSGVRSYYLTKGSGALNAIVPGELFGDTPLGSTNVWRLSGKIAGDGVTAHIVYSAAVFPLTANIDIPIVPAADGTFSVTFDTGGITVGQPYGNDFYIQLKTGAGDSATTLWDLKLTKADALVKTSVDTTAATILGTTPLALLTFNGVGVAPSQERIRAAAFWADGDFWVAFAGGPNNAYAGFCLRWHFDPENQGSIHTYTTGWTFGTLPCTPNSLAQIVGANTVVSFQDRIWYGLNLANGKRVIRASGVGYGKMWGVFAQAGSAESRHSTIVPGQWLFQFIVETETFVAAAAQRVFNYHFPADNPASQLLVHVQEALRSESEDWTVVGHTFDYEAAPHGGFTISDQTAIPGGSISFNPAGGTGINDGDTVKISREVVATDPLDLSLASPQGKIAWMNVLRGLMLGTSRNEKKFSSGALSIDPATGSTFDLDDESSHGADPALNAVEVNDRVLFVQRGRKVLRLAGISITSDGGLVSEDIGAIGEHLTAARVRSLCYLKSPVPRAVFAFDDGTGAVMTLVGKSVAFSRLTIPACFGGLYSVASLDTDEDSELWVGTENGVTLRARTFESDIVVKEVQLAAAVPAAPMHVKYDGEIPLPPVMDGWVRVALVNQGGVQYAQGLPACSVGQSAYALVNGQVLGPYVVAAGGKVVFPADLALGTTWVDAAGARRAQEVYVGLAYPTHRWTSLPLEGGNPVGTSQALMSRRVQLYLRFVDSYLPLVNGVRPAERGPDDPMDSLATRVSEDRRATELNFQRAAVVDVVMDLPLRMEVSAIFGGAKVNDI
jgi:hypothetical protein